MPAGATAVAVNLTSATPAADGFLTGYACGPSRPHVSSANYTRGGARGAFAVVPLSAERTFCVYSSAESDLVVDLQGAFVPEGARLTTREPERLLDTRRSGAGPGRGGAGSGRSARGVGEPDRHQHRARRAT